MEPWTQTAGQPIELDASDSWDPDGTIEQYIWDVDQDGPDASGERAYVTIEETGQHVIELTVVDDDGTSATATVDVEIEAASTATPTPTTTPTATAAPTATVTAQPTATPTITPVPEGATTGSGGSDGTATPADPTPNPTATPTATPNTGAETGGQYTLSELRQPGQQPAHAPDSVRFLAETGAVAVRYQPASFFGSDTTYLEQGTTLNTDDIQFYSTRFGNALESKDLVATVVFYQVEDRQVQTANGTTTERVAANQQVREYTVSLRPGYDVANITLPSHYDQPYRATMWLETDDGEAIDGARWHFRHESIESSQSVPIDTRNDLWWWAGKNILLFAVPGLIVSAVSAKGIIQQTRRGPEKGPLWWGGVLTIVGLMIVTAGYFYTARLFARLPQLFGVAIALVGFVIMLETMGPPARTDEFVRDELEDATAPLGEGLKNTLYRDKARVRTARRDDGLGLIKPGIRPFLARLFADPATLSKSELKTDIELRNGPDDNTYIADPDSDDALVWEPAHWVFNPVVIHPAENGDRSVVGLFERINMKLVAGTALAAIATAIGAKVIFGAPTAGAIVGAALGFLVISVEARDGYAEFTPAPIHYREARATLAALQVGYQDAKTLREHQQETWRERARTAQEAIDLQADRDRTLTEVMYEEETGLPADRRGPGSFDIDPDGDHERQDHSDDDGFLFREDRENGDGTEVNEDDD